MIEYWNADWQNVFMAEGNTNAKGEHTIPVPWEKLPSTNVWCPPKKRLSNGGEWGEGWTVIELENKLDI